jgi:cysteine desulfuration protein SufE
MLPTFDEIVSNFELLDDWEDRYRYLIELGREMPALSEAAHTDTNKVQGCASQVWLDIRTEDGEHDPRLRFEGDSDAHIVKGLVALLVSLLSGRRASAILATDPIGEFEKLGLSAHLTPQRSNGLRSMVKRVQGEAARAAAAA